MIDRGTGLNKDTVIKAAQSLEERGVIRKTRRSSEGVGYEATSYELVMETESDTLVGKSDKGGSRKIRQALVGKSDIQYTVKQYTDFEYSNDSKNESHEKLEQSRVAAKVSTLSHTPSLYTPQSSSKPLYVTQEAKSEQEPIEEKTSFHASFHAPKKGFSPIGDTLASRRSPQPEQDVRVTISAFIKDMASEFNDSAPIKSSVSRACNLFTRANVSMEAFMGSLFEARSITKERSREGKIRAGARRMGYFFSVLGERLGLDEGRMEGSAV